MCVCVCVCVSVFVCELFPVALFLIFTPCTHCVLSIGTVATFLCRCVSCVEKCTQCGLDPWDSAMLRGNTMRHKEQQYQQLIEAEDLHMISWRF